MVDATSPLSQHADAELEAAPRLVVVHAVVFTLGFFLCAASFVGSSASLAVMGGPCLILSAVLSWLGLHINMAGAMGRVFRAALGPLPRVWFHVRIATWLAIGIAFTVWGAWTLSQSRVNELADPAHASTEVRNVCVAHANTARDEARRGRRPSAWERYS